MSPPAPLPVALEKSPPPPLNVIRPLVASSVIFPPLPDPVVPLSTRAPLPMSTAPDAIEMLPAGPAPNVATEILPPPVIVNAGVETEIEPADPASGLSLDAV